MFRTRYKEEPEPLDFVEDIFRRFHATDVIPALFSDCPNASIARETILCVLVEQGHVPDNVVNELARNLFSMPGVAVFENFTRAMVSSVRPVWDAISHLIPVFSDETALVLLVRQKEIPESVLSLLMKELAKLHYPSNIVRELILFSLGTDDVDQLAKIYCSSAWSDKRILASLVSHQNISVSTLIKIAAFGDDEKIASKCFLRLQKDFSFTRSVSENVATNLRATKELIGGSIETLWTMLNVVV